MFKARNIFTFYPIFKNNLHKLQFYIYRGQNGHNKNENFTHDKNKPTNIANQTRKAIFDPLITLAILGVTEFNN